MDYYSFIKKAHMPYFTENDFAKLIANTLEAGLSQKDFRLIVSMPPRHGKSLLITETLPAFYLLHNPHKKVIISSYNQQLATRFGNRNKEKFETFAPGFNLSIASHTKAKQFWEVADNQGALLSAGIFAGLTGMGADLLIIDDPIKNQQEARSYHRRNQIFDEYQFTLRPRLHAGGAMVLIMTRWHEDDLAGRLSKDSQWQILTLPAIAEANDPLKRKKGEALWPLGGYDKKNLLMTKKEIGSRSFEALYQQRPSPEKGVIFERNWWQFYTQMPEDFDQLIHSWDCTFTGKETSDYVVGQVWGKVGANAYLIDQVRKKLDFVETIKAIRSLVARYPANSILIEAKANGEAIISTLRQEIPGIIPVYPRESKLSRALSVTPFIEGENVFLPSKAGFLDDLLMECTEFPNGKHDDMVDALTQALQRLYKGNRFSF